MNLNQKNYKIAGIVILVVLAAVIAKIAILNKSRGMSVVYLTTGEVYVGDLSMWPKMELKNGYILTNGKDPADPTKTSFQLSPLAEALWAPQSLFINSKQVVFHGLLSPESTIAKKLVEQGK